MTSTMLWMIGAGVLVWAQAAGRRSAQVFIAPTEPISVLDLRFAGGRARPVAAALDDASRILS